MVGAAAEENTQFEAILFGSDFGNDQLCGNNDAQSDALKAFHESTSLHISLVEETFMARISSVILEFAL